MRKLTVALIPTLVLPVLVLGCAVHPKLNKTVKDLRKKNSELSAQVKTLNDALKAAKAAELVARSSKCVAPSPPPLVPMEQLTSRCKKPAVLCFDEDNAFKLSYNLSLLVNYVKTVLRNCSPESVQPDF